jgi:hypothetical protein
VERWLGRDVQYAIVSPASLDALDGYRPEVARLIRNLLSQRFEQVSVIQGALGMEYGVFHRRAM